LSIKALANYDAAQDRGFLGMVMGDLAAKAPKWVAVRNVSDPQIKADGLTLKEQAKMASTIYMGFGRWSSVCSAIVCWALVAAIQ
jgi:hypothetical protein